jgi:3'-phosphoadenosine 5'-phosphosulfate sulfotransferase (PAPS reductase)/FAD synthetase
MNIVFSSGGNDSMATVQWCIEQGLEDIVVAYSDTKWSADSWIERMGKVKEYLETNSCEFAVIESEGFPNLVRRKKGFPANGMAFCSMELKIAPAMKWLDEIDPDKKAVCYTGVMQLESENRKNWPKVIESSPNHGGRKLVSPLAEMSLDQRDELLTRSGFEILPHRSLECSPCVNANIKDLQQMDHKDLIKVKNLEVEMGVGERSGKPKFMFRPHRMAGCQGIEQVKAWANQGGGQYSPDQDDLFGCDNGFCGL